MGMFILLFLWYNQISYKNLLETFAMLIKLVFLVLFVQPVYSIGFWDTFLLNGNSRTEYPVGKGAGTDFLTLDYQTDNLPGMEGCQFDAETAFSGCPGRAGLGPLPSGNEVWGGTLQRLEACGGDNTRIGDSWIGCISYAQSPYFEIGSPNEFYWVIGPNDDPSFDQCNEGPPNLSHPVLPFELKRCAAKQGHSSMMRS